MPNSLLIIPEWQFIDQNGNPIAGGQVYTYIPGTTTRKDTFQDANGTTANPFPIILDAAGRGIVWGKGDYRIIVKDAQGNLVYDQISMSPLPSSAISDAMLPVVGAGTLSEARRLLGAIDQSAIDNIQLLPGPKGDTGATGPMGPTGPTGATGSPGSDASVSAGYLYAQTGTSTSDAFGRVNVVFGRAYSTNPIEFWCQVPGDPLQNWVNGTVDASGAITYPVNVLTVLLPDRAGGMLGQIIFSTSDGTPTVIPATNTSFHWTVFGF